MNFREKFPKKDYPFSDELCSFMDNEPDFYDSLKISQPNRFAFIPIIVTSHTPAGHIYEKDEVIGMWYFDTMAAIFKQDFIVNTNKENKEFISYTAEKIKKNFSSKYVQKIDKFFSRYGCNKAYYHNGGRWQHHYNSIDDLPNEIKLLAQQVIDKKLLCNFAWCQDVL